MLKRLAAATALALLSLPAVAGEAGDITREALYSGKFEEGSKLLVPLLGRFDPEASFGQGLIYFVATIERFAQDLYKYGLAAPETGPMLGAPIALPVPLNPNPEALDYQKVRDMLERVVVNLDSATAKLKEGGQAGDYVVMIDPLQIRIDVNGDGVAEETETIQAVFQQAFGVSDPRGPMVTTVPPDDVVTTEAPRDRKSKGDKAGRSATTTTPEPSQTTTPSVAVTESTIGFDRADSIWLAGYSQVFAAQADFLLAHDFEDFVNVSFHRLFPQAKLPMSDYATGGTLVIDPQTDTAIADAIAAIHTINWEVTDPPRLAKVLARFKAITALSRQNWEAILAETDDQRELIPSPRQTSLVPNGKVTDEIVAAWRETLDVADKVLDGELLVPHWRFKQGFDLKAYFETSKRFDLVMLLSGYDALPYLKDGPIADASTFAAANRAFGDEFLGYVFWFN